MSGGIDLTAVIVAAVAGIPGTLSVILTYKIRREQKIPSGGTIGELMERTHDLSAASVAHTTEIVKRTDTQLAGGRRQTDPPAAAEWEGDSER